MKIKTSKLFTATSSAILATVLATSLSVNVYADSDTDTNHSTMHNTAKSGMAKMDGMKAMREKMQAEMQTIINTEDKVKRQALFTAHKDKMQGMMGMMQNMHGDCNNMNHGKSEVKHQGETD